MLTGNSESQEIHTKNAVNSCCDFQPEDALRLPKDEFHALEMQLKEISHQGSGSDVSIRSEQATNLEGQPSTSTTLESETHLDFQVSPTKAAALAEGSIPESIEDLAVVPGLPAVTIRKTTRKRAPPKEKTVPQSIKMRASDSKPSQSKRLKIDAHLLAEQQVNFEEVTSSTEIQEPFKTEPLLEQVNEPSSSSHQLPDSQRGNYDGTCFFSHFVFSI